jgi:hypothetical protein
MHWASENHAVSDPHFGIGARKKIGAQYRALR